jgi:hypothetical protein
LQLAQSDDQNNPAQTPKRQMDNHAAGLNGKKLKAGQNGKACSRAKWQKY